jgi:hypothetical protein
VSAVATRDHFAWSDGGAEWQSLQPICAGLVQAGDAVPWQYVFEQTLAFESQLGGGPASAPGIASPET